MIKLVSYRDFGIELSRVRVKLAEATPADFNGCVTIGTYHDRNTGKVNACVTWDDSRNIDRNSWEKDLDSFIDLLNFAREEAKNFKYNDYIVANDLVDVAMMEDLMEE